jgi:hypothetical protein
VITQFRTRAIASIGVWGVFLLACSSSENPAVATHLAFETQPSASATSTQPLGTVTVALLTPEGHRATAATGNVQISLISDLGDSHLSGGLSSQATAGIATFSDLSVDKAGTAYRLVAKAEGLDSSVSRAFSITVGPPVVLRFDAAIGSVTAGMPMPPVSVSITDAGANLEPAATTSITLSAGTGTLRGTTTVSALNGRAIFTDLSIDGSTNSWLVASAPNLASATSNTFSVFLPPGPCTQMAFFTQPADGKAGTPLSSFGVYCADQYGRPPALPPGGNMTVTVALGNNPTGATLSGTTTVDGFRAATGFNNLVIDKPGTGYTLIVSSAGLASATSRAFNISP